MTKAEIVALIYMGHFAEVSEADYRAWARSAIQDAAGTWVDQGDSLRAMTALQEVARLDKQFGFSLFPKGDD